MANFSGAVRIADLNDFIAPSQQCVVSLNGDKGADAKPIQVSALSSCLMRTCPLHKRAAARLLPCPQLALHCISLASMH